MFSTRCLFLFMVGLNSLSADVTLPAIFSDHAVLARSNSVPVWGKATPGEAVTVTINGQSRTTKADANGRWQVALDLSTSEAGPFDLVVSGRNTLKRTDILVGEVWLASGQSNMEWKVKDSMNAEREVKWSRNLKLREFRVPYSTSRDPVDEGQGQWFIAGPETTGEFSAAAYYFGKKLQKELKVPVGIINASRGGSPVESWTPPEALAQVPELAPGASVKRQALADYPSIKTQYLSDFSAWLTKTGRNDRPTPDITGFVGDQPVGDWTPVTLPGIVAASGLPKTGVFWLRREIDVPAERAGLPFNLDLDALEGYETVYWNGQLLNETTYRSYPGLGYLRWLFLPGGLSRPGKNILALRVYAPVGPVKFPRMPTMDGSPIGGTWMVQAEQAFPDLPTDAPHPIPPACPPREDDTAGYLFNAMIHPLIPYAIRGVVWYQGESNTPRAFQYRVAFPTMIESWRKAWHQPNLPFYFCQITSHMNKASDPEESAWAELREAQTHTLFLPHTGQAITIDLGESDSPHPRRKQEVGDRLALLALADTYDKKLAAMAPAYKGIEIQGDKAVIHFDSLHGRLVARPLPATYDVNTINNLTAPLIPPAPGSEVQGFAICGNDRKWFWAQARIEGSNVVVSSPQVRKPLAVRYAWGNNPTANLYADTGLPVGPFRTDDFPLTTQEATY